MKKIVFISLILFSLAPALSYAEDPWVKSFPDSIDSDVPYEQALMMSVETLIAVGAGSTSANLVFADGVALARDQAWVDRNQMNNEKAKVALRQKELAEAKAKMKAASGEFEKKQIAENIFYREEALKASKASLLAAKEKYKASVIANLKKIRSMPLSIEEKVKLGAGLFGLVGTAMLSADILARITALVNGRDPGAIALPGGVSVLNDSLTDAFSDQGNDNSEDSSSVTGQ